MLGVAFATILVLGVATFRTLETRDVPGLAVTDTDRSAAAAPSVLVAPAHLGPASRPDVDIQPLQDVRYPEWEAARAAVRFPLKVPGAIPPDFSEPVLQSFVVDGPDAGDAAIPVSVVATYSGPDDAVLSIDQFEIGDAAFEIGKTLPADPPASISRGTITVNGKAGYWMAGVATSDDSGAGTGWDDRVLVLTWADGNVGYRLQATGLDLVALTAIARSLS